MTNLWEKLTYQVVELAVIQPDDSDTVKIQPDKDMVTLVTCHPYRSHGKYRYLVYCERVADSTDVKPVPEDSVSTSSEKEEQPYSGTVEFQTSEPDIEEEHNIRIIGAVVILVLLTLILFSIFIPTHKSNQN